MIRTLAVVAATSLCTQVLAAPPSTAPARPTQLADGPLEPLNYFVGDWTIDATWAWGATLKGRNEYRVGLNGQFLEVRTIVRDNDGPLYERYHSFYTHDKANNEFVAWGLAYDGSASQLSHTLDVDGGDLPRLEFDVTNPDGSRLRQVMQAVDKNTCSWKVWMTAPGADTEQMILDDQWERVTSDDPFASADSAPMTGPYAIDAGRFAAAGTELRSFTKTAEIGAPASEVFNAWSTPDGWKGVYDSPESAANIDLAVGGRYEWLFNGALGSNGCQILSYIPDRMLSFTWNAPPQFGETRAQRTWVVVELDDAGGNQTQLTLTHLGFGQGEQWDETRRYFENAWDRVLGAMQSHFED